MKSNVRSGVKTPTICTVRHSHTERTSSPVVVEDNEKLNEVDGVGYLSATGADAWSGGTERISTGVSSERSQ